VVKKQVLNGVYRVPTDVKKNDKMSLFRILFWLFV